MEKGSLSLSARKKRLFSLFAYLTPFLFLVLLELLLQLVKYGGDQRLFVTGPEKQISHYWMCGQEVGKRYFFMQNTKPSPPKDLFLKKKPENGYRIFVMGGSTAAGFPYGKNVMFSRILHFRLQDIFPDKHIEVVNTAMSAVNSYTLLDLTDEILDKQPDAILIYAGHNEFYGALGVGSTESLGRNPQVIYAYLKLKRFKTFLLVRDLVGAVRKAFIRTAGGGTRLDPSNTLMARIVSEKAIPYQSELYKQGVAVYRENLRRIFSKAKKRGVPIIISELVSNIKDQPPFVSVKYDTFPPASFAYEIGRKLIDQGQFQDARIALTYAKDLDALRFRATEEMNAIIHEVAAEFNAPVVPMKNYFEAACEHGLIGNEVILEHLHPNIKGYFIMADAFLNTMRDNGLIAARWPEQRILPSSYYEQTWGLTALDTVAAEYSIRYLRGGWPFKPETEPNRTLETLIPRTIEDSLALRILVDSNYSPVAAHADLGRYYQKKGDYERAFREYKAAYYSIPFELEFYEGAVENLVRLNRLPEALRVLQVANRYGRTPFTDKWTGTLLAMAGKLQDARPYLERAVEAAPNDKQALRNLKKVYDGLMMKDKAAEIAAKLGEEEQEAGSFNPLSDEDKQRLAYTAMLKQAQSLMQKKDYNSALRFFRRAHAIHPSSQTLKWVGMLELAVGDLQDGVPHLEEYLQEAPSDFEAAYNLCQAYIKLSRKQEAQELMKKLDKLRPNFKDPQNLRGKIAQLP
ncbi:MAG: tetratricopeptide repeat protein [candidate division KSB1 bacterium]|nr:tetratricopeptide repeat protein [candidate division KSB1 bacterium]